MDFIKKTGMALVLGTMLWSCSEPQTGDLQIKADLGHITTGELEAIYTYDNPPYYTRSELGLYFQLELNDKKEDTLFWTLTTTRARMVQGQPVGQDIAYDSDPSGENTNLNDHLRGTYSSLLNVPIPLKSNVYGQLLDSIHYEELFGGAAYTVANNSNLNLVLKYLFMDLPQGNLNQGHSWDSTYTLTYSAPVDVHETYTITSFSPPSVEVISRMSRNENRKDFQDVQEITGEEETQINLNPETGITQKVRSVQNLSMQMNQEGKEFEVKFKTLIELDLE